MTLAGLVGLVLALQVPEPPPGAVRWTAPPDCPDGEAVAARIAQRLGRPLDPAEATIDATVTAAAGGREAVVELRVGDQREVRTLTAASCTPLAEAVALLVAAAIEAGARDRSAPAPAPEPEPEPAPAPDPSPLPVVADPPEPRPQPAPPPASAPKRRGPGLLVRVAAGPELGSVLRVSGAVGLGVGALWRRFRLELQAVTVVPRTVERALADVRAGLTAGSLTGCLRTGRGRVEVPLCAGIELGGVRGETRRVPTGGRAVVFWGAALLGTGLSVRVHPRVGVWTAVYAVVAPVRPRFELRGSDPPYPLLEPSPVSGRLLVGVELRLADPR